MPLFGWESMTCKAYRDQGVEQLSPLYPKEEAKALLGTVLEYFCGLPSYLYYTDPDRPLPTACVCDLQNALDDLCRAKPIQYIIGKTLFEGCHIKVRQGVLIPRRETEELVRWAGVLLQPYLENSGNESLSILDLCTGSGAIAIALAKMFPQASIYGVDISKEALAVAEDNNLINQTKVSFFNADVLHSPASPFSLSPHSVDLIMSNPPYVCESEKEQMHNNVLLYEPALALFVPDNDPLLFYRAIAEWGNAFLKEKGLLVMEINERMAWEVKNLLQSHGFQKVTIKEDFNGKPRMCFAIKSFPMRRSARSRQSQCPGR